MTPQLQIFYKAKDTEAPVSEKLTCTVGTEKKEVAIDVKPNRSATSGFARRPTPKRSKRCSSCS